MDNLDNHVAKLDPIFFNLIVPTRNRADTLYFCLKSLLSQNYPDFCITVSDNFSTDNTRGVIHDFNDGRLRYVSTDRPLSMRENWDFALTHVDSGWVSFIGDDDGLMPNALERVAEVINHTSVSAVTSSWSRYTWPGKGLPHPSTLILPLTYGVEIRNSALWRQKVIGGMARYFELPYIYTGGFVDYSVIRKALARKPTFFNSINPDIYSAIATSLLVDEYAYIKDPVALRGTSLHSTGASSKKTSPNSVPMQEFMAQNKGELHPILEDDNFPISNHFFTYECYLQASFLASAKTALSLTSDIRRQLRIVTALSNKKDRNFVKSYCKRILARTRQSEPRSWVEYFVALFVKPRFLLAELKREINTIMIDTSSAGVKDVYAAGVFARDIYWQERRKAFRKVRRILAITRSLFA